MWQEFHMNPERMPQSIYAITFQQNRACEDLCAHLDLKCVLQVTLSSLKYPFILPEVIYPKDNGFLPLCLVYHCVPHVYSPQAFHLRTVSLWILLEFFLYLQPITPQVKVMM